MARAVKSKPFSMRLSRATERFVAAEARRTKRSKGAIVEALAEEAARTRRFPGIAFRGDDAARRPWVFGTGLDVWQIIGMLQDHGSQARLAAEADLDPRTIQLARAYYEDYQDEINEAVAENRMPLDELRTLYPFISVTRVAVED